MNPEYEAAKECARRTTNLLNGIVEGEGEEEENEEDNGSVDSFGDA